MDNLKAFYQGSLKDRVETLEKVKQALISGEQGARESLFRIAQSLKNTGVTYGVTEISQAADSLLDASAPSLVENLDRLIDTMQRVAVAGPDDVATLLIIEDESTTRLLLERKLSGPNRRILVAESLSQAERHLAENQVDLILLDLILPDEDGRNLFARLRGKPKYMATPIIVVSAVGESQHKTECYALGADEFFEKPVDLDALSATVATKLLRAGEVSREARYDSLTGLLNRSGVAIAFARAQSLASRAGYPLSLALADLDGLKRINDTYGHACGDDVLRRVAEVLTESLRRSDRIARWGGDEFVILFPDGTPAGATVALNKVLKALEQETFGQSEPLRVRFSAGVAGVSKTARLDEVVARADRLLYRAKAAGGNRVLTSRQRPRTRRKRILIADDDLETAALVQQRLSEVDLDVVHCTDGTTALATAHDSPVDLAILDIATPGIGGMKILEELRKTATHAETPVILLTAEDSEDEALTAFDLGTDDYIVKPFSPLELRARASRLLKTASRRG
ncbi:MAG: response regulator [Acidobacteriota bacterium]